MNFFDSLSPFSLFNVLTLVGGVALFLFGMHMMGEGLEKAAGGKLKTILAKMTGNPLLGFLLGLLVTAVVQSSSATTVMVVGLVSAGVMTLRQSITVIIGANVGTTITSWILSLTGIEGNNVFLQLVKPSSFTPVLAVIGVVLLMMTKSEKKKNVGTILIGFAVLMFGMEAMSGAVEGLRDVPAFAEILLMFSNPILGVLAGTVLTAIIQSSSASVGILQALCSTGTVMYSTVVPIIMGQNIGTCVTALMSCAGASKDAKRAAIVHLYFNLIGSVLFLGIFYAINAIYPPLFRDFLNAAADEMGIAVIHTTFNVLSTLVLLPCAGLLEKLAKLTIKQEKEQQEFRLLEDRLIASPALALDATQKTVCDMANLSMSAMTNALSLMGGYDTHLVEEIKRQEDVVDRYEDKVASYLIRLTSSPLTEEENHATTKLLRLLGDFERISDHAVDLSEAFEEMQDKGLVFSEEAQGELGVMMAAVSEILDLTLRAYTQNDMVLAREVEPLEEVVDKLKEEIRLRHTIRLKNAKCTIELGFVLSDILTCLERVSDHCSNIAGCIIEMAQNDDLNLHEYLGHVKTDDESFREKYRSYREKHRLQKIDM